MSLMEGSKGGQELGSSLTVCVVSCAVKSRSPVGESASPFIDEGDGFTSVRARMRTLPSLVAHVYPARFPILMGAKGS